MLYYVGYYISVLFHDIIVYMYTDDYYTKITQANLSIFVNILFLY